MNAAIRPILHASSTTSSDSKPSNPSPVTFFVRQRNGLWEVEESRGWAGGIFVSLRAAVGFARDQGGPRVGVVIVGEAGGAPLQG